MGEMQIEELTIAGAIVGQFAVAPVPFAGIIARAVDPGQRRNICGELFAQQRPAEAWRLQPLPGPAPIDGQEQARKKTAELLKKMGIT